MTQPGQIEFLLAESAIRQLYGRYADAVWRRDSSDFLACFTEDAVWKIAGRTISGSGPLAEFFEASTAAAEKVMLWAGTTVLNLEETAATGRTPVTELIKLRGGGAKRTLGIYYDRFVQVEGGWRFAWHHFNLYHYGPPDFSEPYYQCREYGTPPGFPGPDDPTTIRNG